MRATKAGNMTMDHIRLYFKSEINWEAAVFENVENRGPTLIYFN